MAAPLSSQIRLCGRELGLEVGPVAAMHLFSWMEPSDGRPFLLSACAQLRHLSKPQMDMTEVAHQIPAQKTPIYNFTQHI